MNNDLFGMPEASIALPLPGADLLYIPALALDHHPEELARRLQSNIAWREEEITVWGKKFLQPRLTAWYGDDDVDYSYSGIRLITNSWTPELHKLKVKIEEVSGFEFNSVLLNYYRDHRDSMGFHSDDEPELGPRPVIASLSLGEERALIFKHKTDKSIRPYKFSLQSGSLLIMQGDTQINWRHGIEKASRNCGPRVNLTFRQILKPTRRVDNFS